MRYSGMVRAMACVATPLLTQEKAEQGPSNERTQKTYQEALELLHRRMPDIALESSMKADKLRERGVRPGLNYKRERSGQTIKIRIMLFSPHRYASHP